MTRRGNYMTSGRREILEWGSRREFWTVKECADDLRPNTNSYNAVRQAVVAMERLGWVTCVGVCLEHRRKLYKVTRGENVV